MFLNKLKLRNKLLLLISLPILLVLIYASIFSLERRQDLADAHDVLHLARTTELLNIIHRLQSERGLAVTYASDREADSLQAWQRAIRRNQSFVAELPLLQKQLSSENARIEVLNTLDNISAELKQIESLHERLPQDSNLNKTEVANIYTRTIENIHQSIGRMLNLAPGSQIFQLADALTAIADLKEIAGKQRALVSGILAVGHATEADIRLLLNLITKKQIFTERFLKLASPKYQEEFLQLDAVSTKSNNARIIQKIIKSAAGSLISGDQAQWFLVASERIDRLRELEKNINQELIDYANNSREQAVNTLIFTLLLALLIIGTVITITWLATDRLVEGFLKLRDAAVEFTTSGELKNVSVHRQDELGDVANAVNLLIDQLRRISLAVEAVANGDFEQRVDVKSEQDRLALSLNHMISTLRESVAGMQAENWLKSGQNMLAEQVNSEQTLQDLMQKAITHLSEYLQAPVGAIYLVDQDETAKLSASYAYTFRKESRNQFAKGESLVGQAVRERKPIVINQLPPSYVSVSSGLGSATPQCVVVFPLIYMNKVLGVLELGVLRLLNDTEMDFLHKCSENLAVAMHAAISREQLTELLQETQAQSEELQTQQEELEEANATLEEQQQKMQESQEELTNANEELRRNSEELATRNQEVEARSRELESARKALERKAEELAVASKYKSEFLANMSHELRTPLNSLLILSRSLHENEEGNLSKEQVEDAEMIYHGGMELLQLINDILDLSKIEAGKTSIIMEHIAVTELGEKLQRQFLPIAKEKNLQLNLQLDSQLPETLYSDIQKIHQILKNLISNAIKFTEQGQVSLQITSTQEQIRFSVNDTGIGIDASKLESIFDAFQQEDGSIDRQYGGTGLGLTIARKMAHLLGGELSVQSRKGKGSTFTLQLPLQARVSNRLETESQQSETPIKTAKTTRQDAIVTMPVKTAEATRARKSDSAQTLLIIEDDPSFAKILSKLAQQRGYQPIHVATGKDGLLCAHTEKPTAIILDLMLPDIDGVNVLEQLKDSVGTRHIPVHIISARDDNQQLTLRKGAAGYLTKPADLEEIEQLFEQVYQQHQKPLQRALVIEDDLDNQKAICKLLKRDQLEIDAVADGQSGLEKIRKQQYDCVILDLQLPDMTGFDWLKTVDSDQALSVPPVIVYTARKLTRDETRCLEAYTGSIIIKGAHSPERLLDEVTLFLHSIESSLNSEQRRMIRMQHDPGKVLAKRRILLVDDDMRNVFALSKQLKKHGMDVVVADNGEMALEKLQTENDIELVIMDIMMPVMDGYEAMRRIRQMPEFDQLPIIALTARTMPDEQQKCFDAGANDYLSKPVDIDVLLTLMRVLLFKEEAAA